jgi:hypothetical protein
MGLYSAGGGKPKLDLLGWTVAQVNHRVNADWLGPHVHQALAILLGSLPAGPDLGCLAP